jgi:hypothetical protein
LRSRDQVGVVRIERELDRRMGGVIGLDEWSPGEHVLDVSTTSEWLIDWGPRGLAAIAGDGLVDHLSRDWPGFTAAVAAARPPEQHHLHLVTGTLTGGFDGEGVPEIRPRAVMLWAGSPTDGYRVQAERIATAWGLPLDRFEPESDAVPYGDWLAKVEDRASALLVGVDVAELALAEMGDPSVDQLILTVPFEVLAERSDMALLRPSREDREGLSAAVAAWATAAGDEGAVRLGWGSDCLIGFWEYFPGDFTLDCGEGMEWLIEWSADDFVVVAGSALIEHLGSTWAGWSRSAAAAT